MQRFDETGSGAENKPDQTKSVLNDDKEQDHLRFSNV